MKAVGILGGMGPAAGAAFVQLFLEACTDRLAAQGIRISDQAFPEHWLVQIPVPDRTSALAGNGESPLPGMDRALGQLRLLNVGSVAMACNTAHAWHTELQRRYPDIELLHMVQEVAAYFAGCGIGSVGLLATNGTVRARLYHAELERRGIATVVPTDEEQMELMAGILDVKAGCLDAARRRIVAVTEALISRHTLPAIAMACTEVPLALSGLSSHLETLLVDPARILAAALAARAIP